MKFKARYYDTLLFAMFFLGAFSVLSQVTFMREMLVVFAGNELGIGTILAGWLLGISLGAFAARILSFLKHKRAVLFVLALLMACMLPFQIYMVRIIRSVFGIPVGEYASFGVIFTSSLLIFLPTCVSIGIFFPFACALIKDKDPVSKAYTFEATGSMIVGMILSFFFLPLLMPYGIVLIGITLAIATAMMVLDKRSLGVVAATLIVVGVLIAFLSPAWLQRIESGTDLARWRASGAVADKSVSGDEGGPKHVLSVDTIYQNLALFESYGQYSLYGHGRVMFSFPDPISYEHDIHFIMGQNPNAGNVLLLGGNPIGDIPELLKYNIDNLVYVELDRGVGDVLRSVLPKEYSVALGDSRVDCISDDVPRYVASSEDEFDVIIINAPDPSTAWENRYYTREFYEDLKGLLSAEGFICTKLTLSARLQSYTANLGASVYKTLQDVFPSVLVTAGADNLFFAGKGSSLITFDRQILYERSKGAGLKNQYFMPEYFLGYDGIEPDKTAKVEERLGSMDVPLNTVRQPITYYYNLLVWSNLSESLLGKGLGFMRRLDYKLLCELILVAGLVAALAGRKAGKTGWWARHAVGSVIGGTGFCAMAMEVLLIFVFQSLFGYVYTRIGLIFGMFMLGLILGATFGRKLINKRKDVVWLAMVSAELLLLIVAVAVPIFMNILSEYVIYALVVIVGGAVGAEFPLGNRLYREAGGSVLTAAAITDASDHIGAAVGALVMGVLFIPVFGLGPSCILIASLKLAGILTLAGIKRR